jgi:HEAT repeat protein
MARLLQGLPPEQFKAYRDRIANDLMDRATGKSEAEIVQSSILALGLIGTNDGKDPVDKKIRELLASAQKDVSDQQAKNYSMIALAKVGGTLGQAEVDAGIADASKVLVEQLGDGKTPIRPWAGIACGVMAYKLADKNVSPSTIASLQQAVRAEIEEEKDPGRIGALAISAGIMADKEATPALLKLLEEEKSEEAKGYVALGLGLMNAGEAVEKIQKVVEDSKYRPDLLKQSAIALGLLGDKNVVSKLITLLGESKSLATQASISMALGFIGDHRSINPLVEMLKNDTVTAAARGFAAVALGIVADKEPLPWNTKIALDLNYRASTQTLTDTAAGTGILDIL